MRQDFKEISHTGGTVSSTVLCDSDKNISFNIGYSVSGPYPATLNAIYYHPVLGICATIKLPGLGQTMSPPPYPDCIPVILASDSEGKFGHDCPKCKKHFRSESFPDSSSLICPYCGLHAPSHNFTTMAQRKYIQHYIDQLFSAIESAQPDTEQIVEINMDSIVASLEGQDPPDFYYTSIAQQTEFTCESCSRYNDIRGRFGYCASCGTRNNRSSFKGYVRAVRDQSNGGGLRPEDGIKQLISDFDSTCRNYVAELVKKVRMKKSRKNQLSKLKFHDLEHFCEVLDRSFDFKLNKSLSEKEHALAKNLFLKRHVYEHNGCEATEQYITESGDRSVEVGELLRESKENVHSLASILAKMVDVLHNDFLELLPPEKFFIEIKQHHDDRWTQSKNQRVR